MGKKSNLFFGGQMNSQRGIFSIILGIISLIAGIVLIIISSTSRGNADEIIGACGIVAVFTSVLGVIFSILGARESDTGKIPVYIGFLINLVITIAWGCIFTIGINL